MTDNKDNEFSRFIKKKQVSSSSPPPSNPQKLKRGTKHIGGYYDPDVSRILRQIALNEDSTVQGLVGEALVLLFQSRGVTIPDT